MNSIFYNMPADEYRKRLGVANTDLKNFHKSGAHYIESKQNPKPSTPTLLFGSAYHKAVFEWSDFEVNTVVMPEFSGKGSVAAREEWKAAQGVKLILADDDYKAILAMRAKILAHPMASQMIAAGKAEVSAFYHDNEFGLVRKCRADFLPDNAPVIVDLKTTTDASRDEFSRAIYNFGYFQQGAYYLDMFNAVCPETPRTSFCFIAQEKEPPYAVACYFLDAVALELGRVRYRKLLAKFAACEREGRWPGYSDDLVEIGVPKWAKRKEESGADVFYALE